MIGRIFIDRKTRTEALLGRLASMVTLQARPEIDLQSRVTILTDAVSELFPEFRALIAACDKSRIPACYHSKGIDFPNDAPFHYISEIWGNYIKFSSGTDGWIDRHHLCRTENKRNHSCARAHYPERIDSPANPRLTHHEQTRYAANT